MTLRTRRIIYILFFIFFGITAPLVVLYTTGYRWNYYKNKVDKIGNLVIRTTPKKVFINLNDAQIEKSTPWRFNNLLPNKYNIKISKPGFSSWEKNLNVYSGETTFAEHIYLFKINPNITPLTNQVDFWTYNDLENLIIFQKNNELKILNLNNNIEQKINELNEKILESQWSLDKQILLLTADKTYFFWRIQDPNKIIVIDRKKSLGQMFNCKLIKDNSLTILCADDKNIFYLEPFSLKQTNIISNRDTKIFDFYFDNNLVYYLEKNNLDNNIYLRIKALNITNESFPDYLLPYSENYKYLNIQNKKATILDEKNNKLYVLNLDKNEVGFNNSSKIYNDVESAFYSPNNTLVFYNSWEVWIEKDGKTSLITRQANPINQVLWYPSNNHLLLLQKNGLEMIELDDRDKINRTQILNLENINKSSLVKSGYEVIYSTIDADQNENKQNLFMIEILPKETDFPLPNLMP